MVEWGADEALAGEPCSRFRLASASLHVSAPVPPPSPPSKSMRPRSLPDPGVALDGLLTPEAVYAALSALTECPLRATATTTVRPSGTTAAALMLIAEAPGAEEDRSGQSGAGAVGVLLDRMLGSIGLNRTQVLLTSMVPWRPPGGRAPTEAETKLCRPYVMRLLQIVRPRVVLLLGQGPARTVLGTAETVRRLRGKPHSIDGVDGAVALVTAPADQWLRSAAAKREIWADLLTVAEALSR